MVQPRQAPCDHFTQNTNESRKSTMVTSTARRVALRFPTCIGRSGARSGWPLVAFRRTLVGWLVRFLPPLGAGLLGVCRRPGVQPRSDSTEACPSSGSGSRRVGRGRPVVWPLGTNSGDTARCRPAHVHSHRYRRRTCLESAGGFAEDRGEPGGVPASLDLGPPLAAAQVGGGERQWARPPPGPVARRPRRFRRRCTCLGDQPRPSTHPRRRPQERPDSSVRGAAGAGCDVHIIYRCLQQFSCRPSTGGATTAGHHPGEESEWWGRGRPPGGDSL